MKNLFSIFCLVLLSNVLSAQSIAIKGGLNLSNMVIKDSDFDTKDFSRFKTGYHAGVVGNIPFGNGLSLETGLLFSTKGLKVDLSDLVNDSFTEVSYTSQIDLNYLDIPIAIRKTIDLPVVDIYFKAGGYLSAGLSGDAITRVNDLVSNEVIEIPEDVPWGEDGGYKRLDGGATVGLGVEIKSILIEASYDFGLTNISNVTANDTEVKNRVVKLSVGYVFGR